MKTESARVFFALWPDDDCADQLHRVANSLAAGWGGRVMKRSTLHLTLAFVGDVREDRLAELLSLAGEARIAVNSIEPAPLELNRLGYWRHNHILWAGTDRVPGMLEALADRLTGELSARGYSVPVQAFSPHVTLIRKLDVPPETSSLDALKCSPVRWLYRDFVLLRSHRSRVGADYEILGTWSLGRTSR